MYKKLLSLPLVLAMVMTAGAALAQTHTKLQSNDNL
jgi:hypothetical protein